MKIYCKKYERYRKVMTADRKKCGTYKCFYDCIMSDYYCKNGDPK